MARETTAKNKTTENIQHESLDYMFLFPRFLSWRCYTTIALPGKLEERLVADCYVGSKFDLRGHN